MAQQRSDEPNKVQGEQIKEPGNPQADPEVERILTSISTDEFKLDELEKWLGKNLVEGETTQVKFVSLFGKDNLVDLDRPDRDNVNTIEWFLYNDHSANQFGIVFDFDAKTGRFLKRGYTYSICGYCPHILAHDGRWRLEGKLLAGCIGLENEGWDTLMLPRLRPEHGRLMIEIHNPAPEIEYIDQVQLGAVQLRAKESLDVAYDGSPMVWQASREIEIDLDALMPNRLDCALESVSESAGRVLVLEVSNTFQFEQVMRDSLLSGGKNSVATEICVHCDDGTDIVIQPVGTKFLRRVVVPLPEAAKFVQIEGKPEMWFMRRSWLGTSRNVSAHLRWLSLNDAKASTSASLELLLSEDQKRLRLEPGEQASLSFKSEVSDGDNGRWGYILRMRGYYEFLEQINYQN